MNEDLKKALLELGLSEEQVGKLVAEGVKEEKHISMLSAQEIKEISGCGIVNAKEAVEFFTPKMPEKQEEILVQPVAQPSMDVLPQVPDDVSFVNMLKVGGELKVGTTEVIAAIRAALANKSGLYDLPKQIIGRMETFSEEQDQPCGKDFYELQKLVTRHNYAEIFAALEIDSGSVTQAKKDKLLQRLTTDLWPSLADYNKQIVNWVQAWQQGAANPAAMMVAMTSMMSGGQGAMPAGMMQPPETEGLRDEAEAVIDKINKVFAGTGIVIARALALDANRIKEVLENPTLPSQIGATNREQMLKMLDVNVSADYVRLERNITRYALAIMEFPKVTSGQAELGYLTALFQLGSQIPWDKLSQISSGSGTRNKEVRPEGGNNFRN